MEEIFKYKNYTNFVTNLFIHNYVCHKEGVNYSADKILYDTFAEFQAETLTTWDSVKTRGYPLVLGNNGYLSTMKLPS